VAEFYPLFLDLSGRLCLVVGAGRVAERKVEGLLAAGAQVTVVAPDATAGLSARAERQEIRWLKRPFAAQDLDGVRLAFVATCRPEVNRFAAAEARARGIWLNEAGDPGACDFHVPAVLRRQSIAVAVSTSGVSPALAAWARDRLEEALPAGIETAARVLGVLRELTPRGDVERGKAPRDLLEAGLVDDLAKGNWAAADEKVSRFFSSAPPVREILEHCSTEKP
jgi:siroheme synthase-like protein